MKKTENTTVQETVSEERGQEMEEAQIAAKVFAGLSREQALEIIARQKAEDAAVAATTTTD